MSVDSTPNIFISNIWFIYMYANFNKIWFFSKKTILIFYESAYLLKHLIKIKYFDLYTSGIKIFIFYQGFGRSIK